MLRNRKTNSNAVTHIGINKLTSCCGFYAILKTSYYTYLCASSWFHSYISNILLLFNINIYKPIRYSVATFVAVMLRLCCGLHQSPTKPIGAFVTTHTRI